MLPFSPLFCPPLSSHWSVHLFTQFQPPHSLLQPMELGAGCRGQKDERGRVLPLQEPPVLQLKQRSLLKTDISCTSEDGNRASEKGCIQVDMAGRGVEVSGDRPHHGRLPRGGNISSGL